MPNAPVAAAATGLPKCNLDDALYYGTLADDLLHALRMACADLPEPACTGILAIQRSLAGRLAETLQAIELAQEIARVPS